MARRWLRQKSDFELTGPYSFYVTSRRCPNCSDMLRAQEKLSFGGTAKVIDILGMPCYCMQCNGRFRAKPKGWLRFIPWMVCLAIISVAGGALLAIVRLPMPGRFKVLLLVLVIAGSLAGLLRSLVLSRWLWWRFVELDKIFTYQDGGML